jgi:hypothetical protein
MRSRHRPKVGVLVPALLLGAVAFPRPTTARPPRSDAAAARADGTRLFRAKNFEAACPWFEKAAHLAPDDPEPLADLALCRQRLGDTATAEEINRRVIDLGSSAKALTDPRFARSRRHAYFNLRQLDTQRRYLPEAGRDTCGELTPEEGCTKKLFYCADGWTGGGSWWTQNTTRVRIAASAEAARFDEDDNDPDTREHTEPDFDELTQPFPPTPEAIEDDESITYLESYLDELNEWRCDESAWSCDRSDTVAKEAEKCSASAAQTPTSAEACRKDACARARQRPSPAVLKERKVAADAQRSCHASAPEKESQYGCQIAYANACTGLVGLICSGRRSGKVKERTRVEEYLFRPGHH